MCGWVGARVYVYVCVRVCVHVHVYVCVCTFVCVRVFVFVYEFARVCTKYAIEIALQHTATHCNTIAGVQGGRDQSFAAVRVKRALHFIKRALYSIKKSPVYLRSFSALLGTFLQMGPAVCLTIFIECRALWELYPREHMIKHTYLPYISSKEPYIPSKEPS